MYTAFAEAYDLLMRSVDYEAYAAQYRDILSKLSVRRGARVAECACGTGSLTIPLSREYEMIGLDVSGEMLEVAMRKARAQGRSIPLIKQDMTALNLPKKADAVIASMDGVNYLLTADKLDAFLSRAKGSLKAGGALLLDLSTPYKLRHVLGSETLTETAETYAYIWTNRWVEEAREARMTVDIFLKTATGQYDRILENQRQKAWTRDELHAACEKAGFYDVAFYNEQLSSALCETDYRMLAAARA